MNVNQLRPDRKGWQRFDLNIGGFTIKGCKWHSKRRSIFPARYSWRDKRYEVIWTKGEQVKKLRECLESGKKRGPKDANASPLNVRPLKWIKGSRRWDGMHWVEREWLMFSFAINGFRIVGVRWEPQSGEIKMPVTFLRRGYVYRGRYCRRVRQVVTASKTHKQLLIEALKAEFLQPIAYRAA